MLPRILDAISARRKLVGHWAENQLQLFAACAFAGLACHMWLWSISEPGDLFSDFYKAYYPAAEHVWQHGPRVGWPFANEGVGGFVNLPIIADLFIPLLLFGEAGAGWVFFAAGIAASMAACIALARMHAGNSNLLALLIFLFLVNGPMINSLKEGNSTHIILSLLVAGVLLWRAGSQFSAGLVLGFCALIKLPLLLLGGYFVLSGRWQVAAGGVTMIGLAVIMSLAVHGLATNIDWYKSTIEVFMGKSIPALNVQSFDAFLMRLYLGEKHLFDWMPQEPIPAHKIARTMVFAAIAIGMLALARWSSSRAQKNVTIVGVSKADLLAFNIVLLIAVLFSPVSWTHYYLFLLLPWSLYLGGHLPLPDDRKTSVLMWSSIVCCSLPVVTLSMDAGLLASVTARTLVSVWFFGGLLCLAAMCRGLSNAHHVAAVTEKDAASR